MRDSSWRGWAVAAVIWTLTAIMFFVNLTHENTMQDYVQATVQVRDPVTRLWGSGVYISPHCILTAKHVVEYLPDNAVVKSYTGVTYVIKQRILDVNDDLALIYTEEASEVWFSPDYEYVPEYGDGVTMVGFPIELNLSSSVTTGIVSGLNRTVRSWEDVFQVDAWGGPGCSGGPIFVGGKLVGVVVAGLNRTGSSMVLIEPSTHLDVWLRRE